MLVDNAIVVLENIFRMREGGMTPRQAAVEGSREVMPAVIASTLTTLAVFLPLIFVRGMTGIMFKQLSYVVAFSLACSLAVALTLVPMLASRTRSGVSFATNGQGKKGGVIFQITGRLLAGLEDEYKKFLHFALNHRVIFLSGCMVILAGCILLVPLVGVEMMPSTDEGEVRVNGEMAVGTRLEVMDQAFRKIEEIARREIPETLNTVSFVGGSSWRARGGNTGSLRIALVSREERSRSSEEIARNLGGKLRGIPGIKVRTRPGRGLFLLRVGTGDGDRVQIEVRGHDLEIADALAKRVDEVVRSVPGITDTRISRETGTPEELIIVDRQKAADMKLTVSDIANMLKTVLTGSSAGYFREAGDEYTIRVKLAGAEQMELNDILDLPITNSDAEKVILRNVIQVRPRRGPVLIERKDQERVVYISADQSGRDMGSVLADIQEGLKEVPVPRGFSVLFGGDYDEQQKAFKELMMSFVLALVLVYMVMASLYESLRYPFVVMFSVPLAAIGVILMLFLSDTTFNVQSFIGCIMLGGIVVNNAILLVDHINLLRQRDGMELRAAIEEAGRRRLRPILMTAMTTTLAMTPLALGMGEGGEAQAPMARAIIGGLISSNLITLVVVPLVYSLMARKKEEPLASAAGGVPGQSQDSLRSDPV